MLAVSKACRLGALGSVLALALSGASGPAMAQMSVARPPFTPPPISQAPGSQAPISRPVVQAIPGKDGRTLDAALGRLARDPKDIEALIDAGNAALVMGDIDAATGFFRRADQVSPNNPRVKAGLAGAMVQNGDPFSAIPMFEEAEKAGSFDSTLAADRGLAYDLVGDNVTAQRYYRQSMARMPSDEAARRLALSYAIAGDRNSAETVLSPLLAERDMGAWRTRAFALAILGQTEEAVNIANTILPADLAASIAPYLRYMPRLTKAQQAAAANFGAFPRASEIGRDDPRVAQYAPRRTTVAAVDAPLTPQGEALGRKGRSRDRGKSSRERDAGRTATLAAATVPAIAVSQRAEPRVAPGEPLPARETTVPAVTSRAAVPTPAPAPIPAASATSAVTAPPARPPAQLAVAVTPAPAPAPVSPPAAVPAMISAPGFSLKPSALAAPPAPTHAAPAPSAPVPAVRQSAAPAPSAPVPTPTPAPASAPLPHSLAEAFAEFGRPNTDVTPVSGAVDLRGIAPAKPEAKKPTEASSSEPTPAQARLADAKKSAEAKKLADAKKAIEPPKPSHPSRIWVQIATGRDKAALGFDWRRLAREKAEVLRGKAAFISAWGQNNRLLTGPFQSESAASAFVGQLRRADMDDAFIWTSPAGQVVDALGSSSAASESGEASARAETPRPSRSEAARSSRSEASRSSRSEAAKSSRSDTAKTSRSEASRSSRSATSRSSRSETSRSAAARSDAAKSGDLSAGSRSSKARSTASKRAPAKPTSSGRR